MFNAIMTKVLAVVMCLSMCVSNAEVAVHKPAGIIGGEYVDAIIELDERWDNDEIELEYMIEMVHVEDYWMVYLRGYSEVTEDYAAMGIYTHMPTEDDINELWRNRVLTSELNTLMNEYQDAYENK